MNIETKLPVIDAACEVSVIIPVMVRDDGAEAVWNAYHTAMLKTGKTFEVIYVLDGPHATYVEALERLGGEKAGIRIVSLNRSFGEAACIQEGVKHARAETLLILPAHLQVTPDSIPLLLEQAELGPRAIGVVGEYLSRIYDEVKQRPMYVIGELRGFDEPGDYLAQGAPRVAAGSRPEPSFDR